MGTTAEKLTHLSQTKSDIRDAIISKGVSVPVETTFRDYATKVSDIKTDFLDTFNYAERVSQDGGSVENLAEVANLDFNDGAKLNFIPSGRKAGKSYSQVPTDGSGDWMVDRNCEATYIDKDGVMQTAQPNEPRYDWSSGSPVLLREGQRTNLVIWSEDFSSYVNNNIVLSTENGYNVLTPNTTNSDHWIFKDATSTTGSTYSFSMIAKPNGYNYLQLNGSTGTGGSTSSTTIDLRDGSINFNSSYNVKTKILPNGDCFIQFSAIATSSTVRILIGVSDVNAESSRQIFSGDGTSGIKIKYYQVEEGSTATSYIKTEGSTKTRLKDIITVAPPEGTTQIIETIDGVEQTPITTIPATYEISEGNINQIKML